MRFVEFGSSAPVGSLLLQVDQQHGDVGGADTGDSSCLADGEGLDLGELLPGLQAQACDGLIIQVGGEGFAFLSLELGLRRVLSMPMVTPSRALRLRVVIMPITSNFLA